MKKSKLMALILAIALVFSLAACKDPEPEIEAGITCPSAITLYRSETFYYLDGVNAIDANRQSITHKITISLSEGAHEENGILVFDDLGVYVIEYAVYDGISFKTYKASTVLTVIED